MNVRWGAKCKNTCKTAFLENTLTRTFNLQAIGILYMYEYVYIEQHYLGNQ